MQVELRYSGDKETVDWLRNQTGNETQRREKFPPIIHCIRDNQGNGDQGVNAKVFQSVLTIRLR